jgi:hypothetical protein
MYRLITGLFLLALGALGCWRIVGFSSIALSAPPEDSSASVSFNKLQWQGVGSCASSACHGGGKTGSKQSEYTTWITQDPHARAYQVLFNDRSRRIVHNLDGPQAHAAEKNTLCLRCHAMNAPENQRARQFTLQDGVGCESCHGPAEKWLAVHFQPAWQQQTASEKEAWGMRPTKDLLVRAKLCVECHVGSKDADVNHDLIAAGHPRLNFEYGSYLAMLPKHWSERDEKARYPDFEARVWALGQVVCARAALELLAGRADAEAKPERPWPEFGEYNCFACHHDLREPSWRQKRVDHTPLTALSWGDWYYSSLGAALTMREPKGDPELEDALRRIGEEMGKPNPERETIAKQARDAATRSEPWVTKIERGRYDAGLLRQWLRARDKEAEFAAKDWDQSAQRFLGNAAIYHALGDLDPTYRDPALKSVLEVMRKQLGFPRGYDSPRDFVPRKFRKEIGPLPIRGDP